jgi:amino acid transporter
MTTTREPTGAEISDGTPKTALSGSLGVGSIVFMVVAAAAPLTVIGGSAPLGILLGDGVGFPALFAISAVVLLLFSVGFVAMARVIPKPGGFFTYVGHGLGKPAGLATAYLALLTYTAVQIAVHGYVGYILSVTIKSIGGPDLPWWLYSLAVILVVGVLGYRHIDLSSRVLGVLLIGEVGIVLVLAAAVIISGGPEGLSLAPFAPSAVVSGSPGIGLMFAIAAFIGFESTAIFRDEARTPHRTIPRATYIAVIGIGVFYTFASWALVMAWGPSKVVAQAAKDPGSMVILTTLKYLGPVGEAVLNILLITSMFACVLSFHNVISRYQHSMSNFGLLPTRIAAVHPKHLSPHFSSLAQTVTAGALIGLSALLHLDPVLDVFTWFAGVSTLAIAILMSITSIAVVVYFARTKSDRRVWNTVVAPILGLVGLIASAIIIAANFPFLVGDVNAKGVPVFGLVSGILLGIIVLFPVAGLVQAAILRRRNSAAYESITDAISG